MELANQALGAGLRLRRAAGRTALADLRRYIRGGRLCCVGKRLTGLGPGAMMVSELNRAAPRECSQQQDCEPTGSFHWAAEKDLCWFVEHG